LVDDGSHPRYIGDSKKSTEWFGRKNPQIVIRYVKMIPISTSYEKTAWFVRSIWENVSLIWGVMFWLFLKSRYVSLQLKICVS
jgi:hypothetical protein